MARLRHDFRDVARDPRVLGVLLYGSQVTGSTTPRSDVDICVVVPRQNLVDMYEFTMQALRGFDDVYDIRFFEELPLYIQGAIITEGAVIATRDEPALYEYFFRFRKDWEDCLYRLSNIA